jgi:mannosylfructose-phosphate synthase
MTLSRLGLFSVHGYVEAEPRLGATDTGGQVTYVLELARALARQGVAVDLYTRQFDGRPAEEEAGEGVRLRRIPCGPPGFVIKEELYPYWPEFVDNCERYARDQGLSYDLLHSHYWDAGYVCRLLAPRLGLPFVHTSHSLGAWKRERMGGDPAEMEKLYHFDERVAEESRVFAAAAGLTVTNPASVEKYREYYGVEADGNLVVIPPGVNTERFNATDDGRAVAATEGPYLFALSRLDTNKGLDFLLHAFAGVAAEAPALRLVIGGGSAEPQERERRVRQELEDVAATHGLADRVTFTGYVTDEDLPYLYRRAVAFVLPSKFEPFGMTALEAMACGTPVVATNLGGLARFLVDGRDALLVDPSVTEELAGALRRLVADAELAARLVAAGHETIAREFTWEAIARKHRAFYEQFA